IGERVDGRRKAGRVLDIGVVKRKLGKGWSGLDGHAVGGERRQQPLHHGVEGPFAERAADRDNVQGSHDNLRFVYESIKARTATSSAGAALTARRTACGRGWSPLLLVLDRVYEHANALDVDLAGIALLHPHRVRLAGVADAGGRAGEYDI